MTDAAGGDPGRYEQRAALRRKELDHTHRNRLRPSGLQRALSLPFLRAFARGLFVAPQRIDGRPVSHPAPGTLNLAFVGHATFQLVTASARLLTDPLLSDALHGLRRRTAAAIAADDLADVSAVLISHAHADRLHAPSLRRIAAGVPVVVPPGNAALVTRLGFRDVVELAPGDSWKHRDVVVTAVPARHDGRTAMSGDFRGASGYVVQEREVAAYFAGATGYFSGFLDVGARLRPDVALLPITGYEPDALRDGNLSPLDAVYAFEDLRARFLVPFAFGSFPLGYEPLHEPLSWLRSLAAERGLTARVMVLGHGEVLQINREGPQTVMDGTAPVG